MQAIHQDSKAKTFSRARAVEVIRSQYIQMQASRNTMGECLELIRSSKDSEFYQKSFNESIIRYHTSKSMIESLCRGFGIDLREIDPMIQAV